MITKFDILGKEDFVSKIVSSSEKSQIKPVFMLIYLLKKLHSSDLLVENGSKLNDVLPVIIDLLETTFCQFNFMSLKKYFTLISELKLLELLSLIKTNGEFSHAVKKLNHYFPRWTPSYRTELEKKFLIDNPKILDKVEESYAQCRRLIFKLTVDGKYREKYFSEQYSNDHYRIVKESKDYFKEIINALLFCAGSSKLDMMLKDTENVNSNDMNILLLLEYSVPDISDESLMKFFEDLEPTLNSQPNTSLDSCLQPFNSLTEDEDSDSSDSEYEYSQSGSQTINSHETNGSV